MWLERYDQSGLMNAHPPFMGKSPWCLGFGGEGGIRTPDTLLGCTPLAGERLRPLGHLTF